MGGESRGTLAANTNIWGFLFAYFWFFSMLILGWLSIWHLVQLWQEIAPAELVPVTPPPFRTTNPSVRVILKAVTWHDMELKKGTTQSQRRRLRRCSCWPVGPVPQLDEPRRFEPTGRFGPGEASTPRSAVQTASNCGKTSEVERSGFFWNGFGAHWECEGPARGCGACPAPGPLLVGSKEAWGKNVNFPLLSERVRICCGHS